MNPLAWALLALFLGAAVTDWVAVARTADSGRQGSSGRPESSGRPGRSAHLEQVAKPLATAALVGLATAVDTEFSAARVLVVLALLLSLAGDVLLLPPRRFVPGLVAFLLAHLAYIPAMLLVGRDAGSGTRLAGALVAALIMSVAAATVGRRVLSALRTGSNPELVGPVATYLAVISVMVVAAGATGRPGVLVGAVLFAVSDSLIAWNTFVRPVQRAQLLIMTTYHAAQALLVLNLLLR